MWISLPLLITVAVCVADGFHLQHQPRVRQAVCRRAPPCCPGHVCRAYQRIDNSRPVAACARSLESRPLYAPGSQAQQRLCGALPRARSLTPLRGAQFAQRVPPTGFSQSQQGRLGVEGMRGSLGGVTGGGPIRSWEQGRQTLPQRFPAQPIRMPGQDMLGQGQRGMADFPPMPQMPTFGDRSQADFRMTGRRPGQMLGGQPNTFAPLPGQEGFRQGQRSFGTGMDEQLFGSSAGSRGPVQGSQFPSPQFPSAPSFSQSQGFSSSQSFPADQGFSSGQGFPGGQSFSGGQGFSVGPEFSGSQGFQSGRGQVGGQTSFDQTPSARNPQMFGGQAFSGGQTFSGQSLPGQSFGSSGQFGGRGQAFNPIPGGAPQPFLAEQPPVTATATGGSGIGQMGTNNANNGNNPNNVNNANNVNM